MCTHSALGVPTFWRLIWSFSPGVFSRKLCFQHQHISASVYLHLRVTGGAGYEKYSATTKLVLVLSEEDWQCHTHRMELLQNVTGFIYF